MVITVTNTSSTLDTLLVARDTADSLPKNTSRNLLNTLGRGLEGSYNINLYNSGTGIVYFERFNSVASSTESTPIPASTSLSINLRTIDNIQLIASTSSNTLVIN